jgi:hypothetical protein
VLLVLKWIEWSEIVLSAEADPVSVIIYGFDGGSDLESFGILTGGSLYIVQSGACMWAMGRAVFECRAVMAMILPLFTQLRGVNGRCLFLGL